MRDGAPVRRVVGYRKSVLGSGMGSEVSTVNSSIQSLSRGSSSVDSIEVAGPYCVAEVMSLSLRVESGRHAIFVIRPVMGYVAMLTPPEWRSS